MCKNTRSIVSNFFLCKKTLFDPNGKIWYPLIIEILFFSSKTFFCINQKSFCCNFFPSWGFKMIGFRSPLMNALLTSEWLRKRSFEIKCSAKYRRDNTMWLCHEIWALPTLNSLFYQTIKVLIQIKSNQYWIKRSKELLSDRYSQERYLS